MACDGVRFGPVRSPGPSYCRERRSFRPSQGTSQGRPHTLGIDHAFAGSPLNSIRTTLTKLTARVRSARGQSFVEFALLLPVMLVLVLGTVDLGRAYFSSVALENAVKEGAFFGAREPECATTTAACADPHNVESRVEVELNGLTLQSFVAKCFAPGTTVFTGAGKPLADCDDGDLYYVSSKTPFTLVTPLISSLVGGTLTLSSSSTAVVVTSFETGSGTLPIPTTMPTATPAPSICTVPNFLTGPTKISGAQNVWVNIAGFTGVEPHHEWRQRAEHRVAEQAGRDGRDRARRSRSRSPAR